jgi:hypothetical protein
VQAATTSTTTASEHPEELASGAFGRSS